jgi:hypothetical protein
VTVRAADNPKVAAAPDAIALTNALFINVDKESIAFVV